jgi:hypothetical protein
MAFIMQKVGRSKAEIFKILKNGSSSAIAPGDAVCYDYTTAKDGIAVILPTTALLNMFAGCVAAGTTLATSGSDGQYGKVQIYGHHTAARWAGTSTPPGTPLVPSNATGAMVAGATHVTSINTANSEIQFAYAGESSTHVTSLYSTAKVAFIRAM